jgi:hypothetical protein
MKISTQDAEALWADFRPCAATYTARGPPIVPTADDAVPEVSAMPEVASLDARTPARQVSPIDPHHMIQPRAVERPPR